MNRKSASAKSTNYNILIQTSFRFDNYMLTGLQNVLTLFGKQCKAYLDRNGLVI